MHWLSQCPIILSFSCPDTHATHTTAALGRSPIMHTDNKTLHQVFNSPIKSKRQNNWFSTSVWIVCFWSRQILTFISETRDHTICRSCSPGAYFLPITNLSISQRLFHILQYLTSCRSKICMRWIPACLIFTGLKPLSVQVASWGIFSVLIQQMQCPKI